MLTSADVGQTVRVVETATDAGGTTDSPSAVTAVVVSGAAPQNTAPPTVSGTRPRARPSSAPTAPGPRDPDRVHVLLVAL